MNREFILLLVLALFCEAKLSKKKWDRVENKLNTVLEKMIRKFQEIREGHGKYVNNNNRGFHLYLSELAFINQFYSIMTRLVRLSLAND